MRVVRRDGTIVDKQARPLCPPHAWTYKVRLAGVALPVRCSNCGKEKS